jgi:hypothetical protein
MWGFVKATTFFTCCCLKFHGPPTRSFVSALRVDTRCDCCHHSWQPGIRGSRVCIDCAIVSPFSPAPTRCSQLWTVGPGLLFDNVGNLYSTTSAGGTPAEALLIAGNLNAHWRRNMFPLRARCKRSSTLQKPWLPMEPVVQTAVARRLRTASSYGSSPNSAMPVGVTTV